MRRLYTPSPGREFPDSAIATLFPEGDPGEDRRLDSPCSAEPAGHPGRQSFFANEVGAFTDEDTGERVISLAQVTPHAVELFGLTLRRPPNRSTGLGDGWYESTGGPELRVEFGDSGNACTLDAIDELQLRRESLTLLFRPESVVRRVDAMGRLHGRLSELSVQFRADGFVWRRLIESLEDMIGPDGPLLRLDRD